MSFVAVTSESERLVSVVVPLFNEEENLEALYDRLVEALEADGVEFELVFVNDGSRDATGEMLEVLYQRDSRVRVISLSRNFGHQAAISAGLDHAIGQGVIVMDGDLQDPPEVLSQFIGVWRQGYDVVYAVRAKRKEALWKRLGYALFYRLLRATSTLDIPLDSGDFCLMDRKVVDALTALPERGRFVRGLRTFVGFKQVGLTYERAERQMGQPKYTFGALCRLALDGLIGFSDAPMKLVSGAGILFLALTVFGGAAACVQAAGGGTVPAWCLGMLAMFGCTGVQLLGLGIIGEYIRHIFCEIKGRPTYIVASVKKLNAPQRTPSLPKCA